MSGCVLFLKDVRYTMETIYKQKWKTRLLAEILIPDRLLSQVVNIDESLETNNTTVENSLSVLHK